MKYAEKERTGSSSRRDGGAEMVMKKENEEAGAAKGGECHHLAVLVVESEGHARRRQQEQRLLLRQLLPETVDDFWTLVGSLKSQRWKGLTVRACVCGKLYPGHLTSMGKKSISCKPYESVLLNRFSETARIHATFSLCISLRRCEILTFMASSSSSGTWGIVSGSVSSGPWKVSSVRGMYHLLSYCWFLLQREEERIDKDGWKMWMNGGKETVDSVLMKEHQQDFKENLTLF